MRYQLFVGQQVVEEDGVLRAPCVAIRGDTVLNGEFVPAEELAKSADNDGWNVPVPVEHPQNAAGKNISVYSEGVDENQVVGEFVDVSFEDNALKGELLFDTRKMDRLKSRRFKILANKAYNRLRQGRRVYVSTAYFRDLVEKDSRPPEVVNIKPDHLAILVESTPAAKDCGAPLTNRKGPEIIPAPAVVLNDDQDREVAVNEYGAPVMPRIVTKEPKKQGGQK